MSAFLIVLALSQASSASIQDVFCTGENPTMAVEWVASPKSTEAVAISCSCNCTGPENTVAIVELSSTQPKVLLWAEELRSFQISSAASDRWPSVKFYADKDDSRTGKGALVDSVSVSGNGDYAPKGKIAFQTSGTIDKSYLAVVSENQEKLRILADAQLKIGYDLGLGFFKKKQLDKAIDQLKLTSSKLPLRASSAALFNDLGYFLEQANRAAEAIAVLEKVVAFDTTRTPAYLNLADAYQKSGDKAKAKQNYQKYVDQMEKNGKAAKVPARVREFLKR